MNGAGGAWRTISVALHADAGQYVATMASAGGVTTKFGDTVDKTTKKSGASWTTFGKVVAAGALVAGIALAAFIGASIRAAAEFESRMAAVAAVSGATEAELDSLRQKALQLGADTSFSASQAASAMEALVKAGVPVPDVINGAADAVVGLAAATSTDLTQAAEISAAAINQFGLSAQDLPEVAARVAGAANASAIDVDDFGMSISQAGSMAAISGWSFDDLALAIAAMGKAGIVGSDAGTGIKTFLQRLTPMTAEAREEMEKLGLIVDGNNQFYDDATGQAESYTKITQLLTDSLAGMSTEQKIASLQTLFGSDAIRIAAQSAGIGEQALADLNAEIGRTDLAEMEEQRLNTLSGSIEKFKGSVETMLITSGTVFTALLKPIVDGATSFVNAMSEDPGTFFDGLLSTLKPLLPFWHDLVDTGENIVDIFEQLWDKGQDAGEMFATLGGAVVVTSLTAIGDVLETITGLLADNETAIDVIVAALQGLATVGTWALIVTLINKILVAWYTVTTAVAGTAILNGLKMVATGFLTMGTSATVGASMVATGMGAVVAAINPVVLAIGAMAAGWYASDKIADRSAKNAKRRADEFLDTLNPDDSATSRMQEIVTEIARLEEEANRSSLMAGAQELNPWADNSINESRRQINLLNEELELLGGDGTQEIINANMTEVADLLNMDPIDAADWIVGLQLDPATTSAEDMAEAVEKAKRAVENGTPLTDAYGDSMGIMADQTANATEKIDAWKDSLDNALGVVKNVFDARTDLEASLFDMTETMAANGWGGLDATSEGGRANRDAVSSAVDSAIDYVKAIAGTGTTEELEAANDALLAVRETIIQNMESTGIARSVAEDYVKQLGLTPEVIQTQIDLLDPENGQRRLDNMLDTANELDGLVVTTTVKIRQAIESLGTVDANGNPVRPGAINAERENRWGGLYSYARGGVTPAHIARGTRYKWAEPETGGEAFFPRFGDLARNEAQMGTVAGWYGGTYVPRGAASAMAALPQRQPMVAAYQGMSAADVAQIVANMQRPNVAVTTNARTDADPQAISRHTERVLMFGGS